MNRFIRNCLFHTTTQISEFELKTQPVGLAPLLTADQMFAYMLSNFYKHGKQNGFVRDDANHRINLHLILATPIEFIEFLDEFIKADHSEQLRIYKYLKNQCPTTWTATYNFPDEEAKSFGQMKQEMFKANMEIQKSFFNDPDKYYINVERGTITNNTDTGPVDPAGQ